MKTARFLSGMAVIAVLFITSCSTPISLTSWKNPQSDKKVSKIVVMALFGRLDYTKPTEQAVTEYFNSKGLTSIQSLDFLNPTKKYSETELQTKVDSVGADGVMIFTYKGTNEKQNYVPTGYYSYYGGPWGYGWWGGGPFYSGGYWTTTKVVSLKVSLYTTKQSQGALWTADITVTDPGYVDEAAKKVAATIYTDLVRNQVIIPQQPETPAR